MDLKRKMEIITSILDNVRGSTGSNFEAKINLILRRYYNHIGKEFLTHNSEGGDGGNDGWIKDDAVFYQMYSPPVAGTKENIHNKYKNNLDRLLNNVINKSNYGGCIKEYIFIVNTKDRGLPPDEKNFIDTTTNELCVKYNVKIKYRLHNLDYIKDLLETVNDEEVLTTIAYDVNAPALNGLDKYELQVNDILQFLEKLLDKIEVNEAVETDTLERISLAYKIEINNLQSKKNEMLIIQSKLDVVEKAIKILNDPVPRIASVIAHFVKIYQDGIAKDMDEFGIYNHIIEEVMGLFALKGVDYEVCTEYTLVYIIERCSIFKTS